MSCSEKLCDFRNKKVTGTGSKQAVNFAELSNSHIELIFLL